MKPASLRFWIFAGVILFFVFRIFALLHIAPAYDEMVQNYMADDISRLDRFPVYFDGQRHMGPIDSYFIAPFFKWFGFTYVKARIYHELLYVIFAAIYLGIIRKLFDQELTVYLWVLLAVVPFTVLYYTTIVGYEEILPLAVLSLFILLKMAYGSGRQGTLSFLLGVVTGQAFWANSIFVIWFPALILGLWAAVPGAWKKGIFLGFTGGFLVGIFPIWAHGLRTGEWLSLVAAGGHFAKQDELGHFIYLFFARLKYFLTTFAFRNGAQPEGQWMRYASVVPLSVFAFSFASFVYSWLKDWRAKSRPERVLFLFTVLPPAALLCLYSSRQLSRDEGLRYFIPLLIPYAFVIAWQIRQFRPVFLKWVALGSMTALLSVSTLYSLEWALNQRSELLKISEFLRGQGLRYGIAEMNLAYPLNALDQKYFVVTPVPQDARYRPILSAVREKGPSFLILEKVNRQYRGEIEADPALKRVSLYGYDIFYGQSPALKKILE